VGGGVGGVGRGGGVEGAGEGVEVAAAAAAAVVLGQVVGVVGIEEGEGERKTEARGGMEIGLVHSMRVRRRWGRAALRISYRTKSGDWSKRLGFGLASFCCQVTCSYRGTAVWLPGSSTKRKIGSYLMGTFLIMLVILDAFGSYLTKHFRSRPS